MEEDECGDNDGVAGDLAETRGRVEDRALVEGEVAPGREGEAAEDQREDADEDGGA